MQSVFFNKGENCIAAGRLFVEDKIHDEFVRRVVSETKKMAIGDPLNKSTSHGPQNHLAHLKKLLDFVEIGKASYFGCLNRGKIYVDKNITPNGFKRREMILIFLLPRQKRRS